MSSAVVDANVFKLFYDDMVASANTEATVFMHAVLCWGHIALDERGLIEQEWRETACGANDEYFRSWISARLIENKIQLYEDCCHARIRKIVVQIGVPAKDRKYVHLAISSRASVIFSHDIDLYEPKAKKWPEKTKKKIKDQGTGCVCTWLRRDHGIKVCQIAQYAYVLI